MVSGIIGALDTAPTSHFVDPGLKLSGEEWVKVMGPALKRHTLLHVSSAACTYNLAVLAA